jgi:hypothetical protein
MGKVETNDWLVPIDKNISKYKAKWICVCNTCQNERIISYSQAWNLINKKHLRTCKPCGIRLGLIVINKDGLIHGRKYNPAKRDKVNCIKTIYYRQLFAPETLSNPIMREKQSKAKLGKYGALASRWEGGKTSERKLLSNRQDYKLFRLNILIRDNYTCKICLKRGGKLEVDHIKEWCNYPELRMIEDNCRTLCKECHKKTDNYAYRAKRKNTNV